MLQYSLPNENGPIGLSRLRCRQYLDPIVGAVNLEVEISRHSSASLRVAGSHSSRLNFTRWTKSVDGYSYSMFFFFLPSSLDRIPIAPR